MQAHELRALSVLGGGLLGATVIYFYGTGRPVTAYTIALATAVTGAFVAAAHTVAVPITTASISGLGRLRVAQNPDGRRVIRPSRVLL